MEKSRLEAFTDGVFAIVITLLVLDIKLPDNTTGHNLDDHLTHILPALGAYALSFAIVGMYWVAHHLAARMFKSIDTRVLWLNIIHLFFVCLIPFTTSLLSKFTFSAWAVAIYGINILLINLAGWLVVHYLYRHQQLARANFTHDMFIVHRNQYLKIALLYATGIVFSFINPHVSLAIYGLVTIYVIGGTIFPSLSWRRRLATN